MKPARGRRVWGEWHCKRDVTCVCVKISDGVVGNVDDWQLEGRGWVKMTEVSAIPIIIKNEQ